MASTFERVDSRLVHSGHIVQFYVESFVGPSGERFDRDVIRHPGAASVVPLHDDGTVTLVRQFRAALGRELLEIPAGKIDVEGESPELTVQRELAEEVGLVADRLVLLSSFVQSPGFCDEVNHVFLATGLSETERSVQGVEEEHMTIHRVALRDVPDLIASGELVDGKSIVGLMIALHQLGR
jgi:8-oxo-dGTP pyrophosphatase MutT (NUDIX family)